MNKQDFFKSLSENNIDLENICFNDGVKDDVFCVRENYTCVEVFYRERGKEYDLQKFLSLSQALEYLLNKILKMTGKL
ncbi:MAG: hypothetical protein RR177_02210 [Oscillospiraceae bacterium]